MITGMARIWILVLTLITLSISSAGHGKAVRKQDQFDPEKAYLLFQLDPILIEDNGKSIQRARVLFSRYDSEAGDVRGVGKAADNPVPEGQSLSVEGFKNHLVKAKKKRLYLLAVEPDTWTIQGTGIGMSAGPPQLMTSFSLGSYTFDVKPGQIIDFGVLTPVRPISDNPDTKLTAGKLLGAMFNPFGGEIVEPVPLTLTLSERAEGDIGLPDWIAVLDRVKPELTYGNRFGNYAGGLINRIDGKAGRERAKRAAEAEAQAQAEAKAEAEKKAAAEAKAEAEAAEAVEDSPADETAHAGA